MGVTILTLLILLGCWTCWISIRTPGGLSGRDRKNIPISQMINQIPNPLIISNAIPYRVLTLVHVLKPEVKVQLLDDINELEFNQNFDDIFIYHPIFQTKSKSELLDLVQDKYQGQLEEIYIRGFYKLTKN